MKRDRDASAEVQRRPRAVLRTRLENRTDAGLVWPAQHLGFLPFSDRSIVLSWTLNFPDVSLFDIEFLPYHEALHADIYY